MQETAELLFYELDTCETFGEQLQVLEKIKKLWSDENLS
jgi:hypothetical protein